jgi:hypothetical protein
VPAREPPRGIVLFPRRPGPRARRLRVRVPPRACWRSAGRKGSPASTSVRPSRPRSTTGGSGPPARRPSERAGPSAVPAARGGVRPGLARGRPPPPGRLRTDPESPTARLLGRARPGHAARAPACCSSAPRSGGVVLRRKGSRTTGRRPRPATRASSRSATASPRAIRAGETRGRRCSRTCCGSGTPRPRSSTGGRRAEDAGRPRHLATALAGDQPGFVTILRDDDVDGGVPADRWRRTCAAW